MVILIRESIIQAFSEDELNQWIEQLNQVAASEKRLHGQEFTLRDHIRGMVLAMLSNQRPWQPIGMNLDYIDGLFHQYDPEYIITTDPEIFRAGIQEYALGNRNIAAQMRSLSENVQTMHRIIGNYGSMDAFVTHVAPFEVARIISDPASGYKLNRIGIALALEYLRNVGIRVAKPDTQLRRLLGPDRLNLINDGQYEEEIVNLIDQWSQEFNLNPTYVDNVLWIFCSKGYAGICTANPRCQMCLLREQCNHV